MVIDVGRLSSLWVEPFLSKGFRTVKERREPPESKQAHMCLFSLFLTVGVM